MTTEPFEVISSTAISAKAGACEVRYRGRRARFLFEDRSLAENRAREWSSCPTVEDIRRFGKLPIQVSPNYRYGRALAGETDPWTWASTLESGRSYLYGTSRSIADMLKKAVPLSFGMALLVRRAWICWWEQYEFTLELGRNGNLRREYHVRRRNDFVEIELPYHSRGGEKGWITRDLRKMVLVNLD